MKTQELSTLKTRFDEDGFISIPGFLGDSQVDELNQVLQQFITEIVPGMAKEHIFYEDKNDISTLKQMQDLHLYDPYFQSLLMGSRFEHLAEVLLQEKVVGKNIEYFNKPARIGKPTPPHQDNYYFMLNPPKAVTMWLALEKVDAENGCVRYRRGSHLRGMRPHRRSNIPGFSQGISGYDEKDHELEIAIPVKAGDLLVHHSMTIHRADGNRSTSRSRKALGFIYFASSAEEDLEKKEIYRKLLLKEM